MPYERSMLRLAGLAGPCPVVPPRAVYIGTQGRALWYPEAGPSDTHAIPPRPHVQRACLPAGGVHWRAKPDPLPEDEPDPRV